ncbi:hypothetical protein [Corynebacterium epidermidicanis]|uniref:Uncharacterized protein n=1 Tax=Corynebacterium epidermidicanis TaxID=1050174 RepID=A0A0G3GL23_9CORY|nr:hypothetical protein [Corynebacterium epidermidicanis]AKK01941.1 hypothetical protein CEPID_00235 [Corynebacterium epidermidicanis]
MLGAGTTILEKLVLDLSLAKLIEDATGVILVEGETVIGFFENPFFDSTIPPHD